MRRLTLLLIGVLMSLLFVGAVFGLDGYDDRGNLNDPRVNERANACYDGGTLAGKCDTQVEWDAGWYLIRFEYGLIGCDGFPSAFAWAKPASCTVTSGGGGGQIGPILPTPIPTNTPMPL
jgi:hypothetical protein